MKKRVVIRILGVVVGVIGFGVLSFVFGPMLLYQINAPKLATFLSPLAEERQVLAASDKDYTKASSWFPNADAKFNNDPVSFYKLSIPRLNIKDANVAIGGEDLGDSLIQYPGTALPGENGNAVIFGHSVLPSFYNPKNYLTIFSTIPTLVKGDTITVNFDGITYKYNVIEKYVVDPSDIQILDQDRSDSYLTLVTCVPPGLTTYREIIKAKIVPVKSN